MSFPSRLHLQLGHKDRGLHKGREGRVRQQCETKRLGRVEKGHVLHATVRKRQGSKLQVRKAGVRCKYVEENP